MAVGSVMYLVHCLYDWDWDIPAITLPALLFLGVLVASPEPVRRAVASASGRGARAVALMALTLCACVFALSAALPSLAASKASRALVEASGSASEVKDAQSTAQLASRLDPLSRRGLAR